MSAIAEPLLSLPGIVQESRTRVVIFDTATEQQHIKALIKARELTEASCWMIGEVAISLQALKQRELDAEAAELRERANQCSDDQDGRKAARSLNERADKVQNGVAEYTGRVAESTGLSVSHIKNCVFYCRAYPPSYRKDGLSFFHHVVALKGEQSGEAACVQSRLKDAEERALPVSQLRKEINMALATATKPKHAPLPQQFKEGDLFDRWCMHHADDVFTKDVAANLLSRFQAIRAWLRKREAEAGV